MAFRNATSQEELDGILVTLSERLLEIGVTQDQLEAIGRLVAKSGIVADITMPEMGQKLISVLSDALRMIAAGEGDYISPSLD